MDPFSIVAAVGSFMVSERLLPPKSILNAGMSFLFIYDMIIYHHDYASLRVYRGPGLLAFTFCCIAYSLRIWRRNGIACDELLFLPGTIYAERFEENYYNTTTTASTNTGTNNNNKTISNNNNHTTNNALLESFRKTIPKNTSKTNVTSGINIEEDIILMDDDDIEMVIPIIIDRDNHTNTNGSNVIENRASLSLTDNDNTATNNMVEISLSSSLDEDNNKVQEETPIQANDNEGYGYEYSPSAPSVFGASLDLAFPVLFNFHLFTEAKRTCTTENTSEYTIANILPLIFLTVLYFRAIIPPSSRKRFWSSICYIFTAPIYKIIFRDDIIGDLITSFVRSIQDFIFTFFYYYTVTRSVLYPSIYRLKKTNDYLESNWLLHCIILPCIAIGPLWWKFLQSLRKYYDDAINNNTASRIHLCHAFKYLTSSMIVFYSLTHPLKDRSIIWFLGFAFVTLYQIYCDVFLDWELFIFEPITTNSSTSSTTAEQDKHEYYYHYALNASFLSSPINYCVHRFILQPIYNAKYVLYNSLHLRKHKHVFKDDKYYYAIFWFNFITRCCWMMNFLPTHYIDYTSDESKIQIVRTFSKDFNAYLGMLVSVVEIIRRTLWAILVVELQSIKLIDGSSYNSENTTVAIISWLFAPIVSKMHTKFGLLFSSYKYKQVSMTIDDDDDSNDNDNNINDDNIIDDFSIRSSIKSLDITIVEDLPLSSPMTNRKLLTEEDIHNNATTTTATTATATTAHHQFHHSNPTRKKILLIFELSCWFCVYIYFGYLALSH